MGTRSNTGRDRRRELRFGSRTLISECLMAKHGRAVDRFGVDCANLPRVGGGGVIKLQTQNTPDLTPRFPSLVMSVCL